MCGRGYGYVCSTALTCTDTGIDKCTRIRVTSGGCGEGGEGRRDEGKMNGGSGGTKAVAEVGFGGDRGPVSTRVVEGREGTCVRKGWTSTSTAWSLSSMWTRSRDCRETINNGHYNSVVDLDAVSRKGTLP